MLRCGERLGIALEEIVIHIEACGDSWCSFFRVKERVAGVLGGPSLVHQPNGVEHRTCYRCALNAVAPIIIQRPMNDRVDFNKWEPLQSFPNNLMVQITGQATGNFNLRGTGSST